MIQIPRFRASSRSVCTSGASLFELTDELTFSAANLSSFGILILCSLRQATDQ